MYTLKMDINEIVGKNLKRLRDNAGFTQEQLAKLAGTSKGYISDIERGIRNLGKDVMERFCKTFKVESWEFHITNNSPIASTNLQSKALEMAKEAEISHVEYVAEENIEYTINRIKTIKKQARKAPRKSKILRHKKG